MDRKRINIRWPGLFTKKFDCEQGEGKIATERYLCTLSTLFLLSTSMGNLIIWKFDYLPFSTTDLEHDAAKITLVTGSL
jgi:hypothetical protein